MGSLVNSSVAVNNSKSTEIEGMLKEWNKIEDAGINVITEYLKAMGYLSVSVVSYNEMAIKVVDSILKDSDITLSLCVDKEGDANELKGIKIYTDVTTMLQQEDVQLVIDADSGRYQMRRYFYDNFNNESCELRQFLRNVNKTEIFNWYIRDMEHREEMLNDFINLLSERYKNIALYGESRFIDELAERLQDKLRGNVLKLKKEDVAITESGQKFEIFMYSEELIDGVIYLGINAEATFVRNGRKLDVVNTNSICKELSMSYDLAYDVLPRLKEKGVKIMTFLYPELYTLNGMLKARGKEIFRRKPFFHNMVKEPRFLGDIQNFFGELYSQEYVSGILKRPSVIEVNGVRKYADFHSDFYNVFDGHRVTTDCPEKPRHTIHMFGKCVAMGRYVEDKNTIASQLQRYINNKFDGYQVVNYGIEADTEINKKLKHLHYREGDVVLIVYRYYEIYHRLNLGVNYLSDIIIDMTQSHREYFLDTPEHFNHRVNGMIAERIYKTIECELHEDDPEADNTQKGYFTLEGDTEECRDIYPGLEAYIQSLQKIRIRIDGGNIGAIVMNCNPFTLGHKYLIDESRKKCEILYVFVVEEDKSVFSFEDRFEMVKAGTAEFDNVFVMPSGSFMISTMTFPEYFNKDDPGEVAVDPSNDVTLFGEYIAPALGINIRFAGEEPIDMVTRQYNETMRRILPSMGVEFEVIPRKESDGEVISASRVRKYLRVKNFVEIHKMVPETTFRYLVKKFG